jgi:hypothetical protein
LVELVNAVAHARDVVGSTVRVLEKTGHSSGADTVCGLLFGYAPGMVRRTARAPLRMRSKPCAVAFA